ncbi:MAG: indole-3-glycerol-phosphate synthase [Candidatus Schekmanbacteria bacterium]|nr:indole-3-glycerol-phosphate synthase [Candidatus Schekmanbacteria bacterium]
MSFLESILADKRGEIVAAMARVSAAAMRAAAVAAVEHAAVAGHKRLTRALQVRHDQGRLGVIAEIKARSPSRGELAAAGSWDPVALACRYAAAGVEGISVLTDRPHFGGELADLQRAAAAVPIPVLRKDFIISEYQIDEAAAAGAAAVLLIAAACGPPDAQALDCLRRRAAELGLDVLVEVHTRAELERVLALDPVPDLIGINARDLATFRVDIATIEHLAPLIPRPSLIVGESGVWGGAEAARLAAAGCDAVLVGEALVRAAARPNGVETVIEEIRAAAYLGPAPVAPAE